MVEDLASEPDFTNAEVRAEEPADDDLDTSLPITDPIGPDDLGADALAQAAAEPVAVKVSDEPEPTQHEPVPTAASSTCDDCGASLTPTVVAYCQSQRGQATFGGASYCYACQKKHRPARKAVAR